ncbi:MAG: carbohydrate ABC transporter permease [Candidatus Merdivicinus sp.]|jgi:putative aldouronate transport system permease protein
MHHHAKSKPRDCRQDIIYYGFCYTVIAILTLLVLYPIVYVVSASFSSGAAIAAGRVWLYPVDFSLRGYQAVLKYRNVWIGYRNTIFYTVVGTAINIILTLICAYPLARKSLRGRSLFTFLFTFTMIFSGGMIPGYLLVKQLHMINTVWAMLLPGAMSVYNMIVTRTFIQSTIPDDLLEAAKIDGCSDARFFFRIVLPLSKAVIAVIALFYAVGHWNAYFNAFLYLSDKNLYPLQIFLKDILVQNQFSSDLVDPEIVAEMQNMQAILKYSMIAVSTAPLFCFYPFAQKHFVKGVMIGSVKG